MNKKFNIHDWQAKRRLAENDEYQKRQDKLTPGKNPEEFYDDDSLIGKLKKDPNYIKKLNAKSKEDRIEKDDEELAGVKHDIGTMGEHHNDENFPGKDLSAWDLLDKIKAGNEDLYNKVEDFMKAMDNKDDSPDWWKDAMTQQPNPDLNEDEVDENSLGGGGAGSSFNSGNSGAFATKNAFKKKKK